MESVDIEERIQEGIPQATGYNVNVGWIATGEWLQYSTFVTKGGKLITDYCITMDRSSTYSAPNSGLSAWLIPPACNSSTPC